MYARPSFEDGETTTLGVSGKLWREALIMYDRRSKSLWSQIDGEAKAGPLAGEHLAKIPSQVTTWATWKKRHPDTLVLVKPALEKSPYESYHSSASWVGLPWKRSDRDDRLPGKTLVLGLELEGQAAAVRPSSLESSALVAGEIGGRAVVVVGPQGTRSALVYSRELKGALLDLSLQPADGERGPTLIDRASGSLFDWHTGQAVAGPLAGQALEPLAATPIYWATWSAFYPDSALW